MPRAEWVRGQSMSSFEQNIREVALDSHSVRVVSVYGGDSDMNKAA